MSILQPTYYTRHPDETYSVADPQPTIQPVKQEPVAWHDKIKGMEVSVDVSTGEDDAHHRVFGRVDSVMLESCGAQEDIILVIEESRNYAAPVQPVKQKPVAFVSDVHLSRYTLEWNGQPLPEGTKLYAEPVQPVKQEPVAWDLAEKVRRDLDRQSCPDAYMRIAIESIVKHFPAPPPVQEITEDVDAAMVEMKNIYPPLRRSECERLIRAAKYAAPVSAEAIRSEALEEAEEIAKTIGGSFSVEFLAAIRGLK